jgi:hypothetical protein
MKPTDKHKRTPPPAQSRPRPKAKERVPGTSPVRFSAIVFNIAGAIVSVLFLMAFFQHNDQQPTGPNDIPWNYGYDWVKNSMLASNLKQIEENPGKSVEEKYLMKWGPGEIVYVYQIKKSVPDTGIILLPPHDFFKQEGFVMTQNGPVLQPVGQQNVTKFSMIDIPWITYFLYPRRVVYGDSVNNPLYAKANYLVSFNGWGLDKLNYKVEKPAQFMVLPIKK